MKQHINILKNAILRMTIAGLLVSIFFGGIVTVYYKMVFNEKKSGIIKSGELAAKESADQFTNYLSTNIDLINLTAYTLNKMMAEGCTEQEIQDYLVDQSTAVRDAVQENSTGLYGYINGRFYSGTNWEPPADYIATSRPWYTKPLSNPGNLTILEPYIDVQTGNTMLALGKTLIDNVSVISIDVSLDRIQDLTEEAISSGGSDIEMIISGDGTVITHSDVNEIGKNYRDEKDSLGAEILRGLAGAKENYYEFKYDGKYYIVYDAPFQNDWYCVSVHDATSVFNTLKTILIVSIIVIITIIIILAVILHFSAKRSIISHRLGAQLSSAADIYRSAHDIDIINDTFTEIVINNERISNILGNNQKNAQATLFYIMDKLTAPESKETIHKFVDFSTLDERLEGRKTIATEFLNTEDLWLRGRFIVSQKTPLGRVSHVLWMVEDINEEKRHRDELIYESQKAIAASEAKSSFLSNMSHEIRTPINAVLGMNEMILRESKEKNVLAYSENIKNAGNSLLGIVNNILDFSKIEAGKMEIIPVSYDLANLLNELINTIKGGVDSKGLSLTLDFDRKLPCRLIGDEVRIRQVITNLLTNAVKYTEKGGIVFSVGFTKDESDNTINLNVSVKDTGIGIKEEDMEKLFTEFERIEEKRNRNIEGTGLGMNIVMQLLDLMGSSLKVESTYGFGSKFSFSLKQKVENWEELGDYESRFREISEKYSVYREVLSAPDADILAVDDNPMNLLVFEKLLELTQVKIDTADSGDKAIELTQKKKYDIVFLDHMMPDKDGIETLNEIRASKDNKNIETPIVCLTANAISGAREQYLSEGFDDYLTKPVNAEKLEKVLIKYLPESKVEMVKAAEIAQTNVGDINIPDVLKEMENKGLLNVSKGIENSTTYESFLKLLEIFYLSIDEKAEELDKFYEDHDFNNYTIKIHALKSSARIIGAADLGEEAQALENAGKENDESFIKDHHDPFIKDYTSFKPFLEKLFSDEDKNSDLPEAGSDLMEEAFTEIRKGAEDMDCDRIMNMIETMDGYHIPDSDAEIWRKIRSTAMDYDYYGILEILENKIH